VRTSGGAAVGVVTELVDMDATLSVGVVAGDIPGDGGGGGLVGLLKGDSAGDLGVTTENSDWKPVSISGFFLHLAAKERFSKSNDTPKSSLELRY
jgi:hypothetical protein